jgi:hypothetical protein
MPPSRGVIPRHTLTATLEGFDLVLLDSARSSNTAPEHRHPGAVLGYVLDARAFSGIFRGSQREPALNKEKQPWKTVGRF